MKVSLKFALKNFLFFQGDNCCWHCQECQPYERLLDEFTCEDCGDGRWPHANKSECMDLPQKVIFKDIFCTYCTGYFLFANFCVSYIDCKNPVDYFSYLLQATIKTLLLLFHEIIDIYHKQNCKNKQIILASIIYSGQSHAQFQDVSWFIVMIFL